MENTPQSQENTSNKYYISNDNNSKGSAYKLNELLLLKRNGIITKDTLIIKDSDAPKPAGAFIIFNNNYTINTSGTGNFAKLPKELNAFNIGACILSLFWGYSHFPKYRIYWITLITIFCLSALFNVYVNVTDSTIFDNKSLLLLIKVIPNIIFIITSVIFLTKGNEIAWKNRKFKNLEEFKTIQNKWLKWSLKISILLIILFMAIPYTPLKEKINQMIGTNNLQNPKISQTYKDK